MKLSILTNLIMDVWGLWWPSG